MEPAVAVEDAEIVVAEADNMQAAVDLSQLNCFAFHNFVDEYEHPAPFDFSGGAHAAHLVVSIVPGLLHHLWQSAQWPSPMGCRCRLAERFMWPLLILVAAKLIEANLLLLPGLGRRIRSLGLHRSVHVLVAAVVLRA